MILPDSRCEIHGEEFVMYLSSDRGRPLYKKYCRACRRERDRARNGGLTRNSPLDPYCKRGHPKTPFNYRFYGGMKRCVTCDLEDHRVRNRREKA